MFTVIFIAATTALTTNILADQTGQQNVIYTPAYTTQVSLYVNFVKTPTHKRVGVYLQLIPSYHQIQPELCIYNVIFDQRI